MTGVLSGRCLCKAVTYRGEGKPLWVSHYHCESCRRASSAPLTTFFALPDSQWAWTGEQPALYQSSPVIRRWFCGACGSQMAYARDDAPGETHFYAASLDDPLAVTPTEHDFADECLAWLHLSDDLPLISRDGGTVS